MNKPRILVFASGSAEGGGSGFEKLVEASRNGPLNAEIVAVVSNHMNGGVRKRADSLGIRFLHFPGPWTATEYQKFANGTGADFFALSGWLKLVVGLDLNTRFNPKTVFNIHPGPLPRFGGPGMYGHHVHEAVIEAFKRGEITHSAATMHFTAIPKNRKDYDKGPVFLDCRVKIEENDTPDSLQHRVNACEHYYQSRMTNLVVNGLISWDGVNPDSLICPRDHEISFVDQE